MSIKPELKWMQGQLERDDFILPADQTLLPYIMADAGITKRLSIVKYPDGTYGVAQGRDNLLNGDWVDDYIAGPFKSKEAVWAAFMLFLE